jgi:hypothetical protein
VNTAYIAPIVPIDRPRASNIKTVTGIVTPTGK